MLGLPGALFVVVFVSLAGASLTMRIPRLVEVTEGEVPATFTYHGTGTYLIGDGDQVVVIDPGPDLPSHQQALEAALQGQQVAAILVTHCHSDHSPSAAWSPAAWRAPAMTSSSSNASPAPDSTPATPTASSTWPSTTAASPGSSSPRRSRPPPRV